MFIGEYNHSVDPKGRLAIPAKFRLLLKKGAVVTRGLDSCLAIYPRDVWDKVGKKLASIPSSKTDNRSYARFMLAGAMEVAFDSQGRIMLPEYLRKFAAIKKSVIIAGLYDKLEVWDAEKWDNYRADTEKNSNRIAEALGDLGV